MKDLLEDLNDALDGINQDLLEIKRYTGYLDRDLEKYNEIAMQIATYGKTD